MSSNLGKLFCSIINARLLDFITTHNVLSRSQIGFLPNYRTSDHIYTLHTLIEKHVNQDKGKIYACFIDFKKAFDSIWHQGLFYKLIESGIGGKTYDLIKSMYTESKCGVKINTKRTRYLSQEREVRQGCCLSPTLSHIIIHTGTNNLRREQERVGQLICRVAEKATEIYPNTKITISTLLPRRDIHPDTIQRANADISKGCARLPNVHLAHHPSITIRDLYDHVHIRKDKVNVFCKNTERYSMGRQTTYTPLKTAHLPTHRTQIQTPSRNTQSHHRERPPLDVQYGGPPHHAKFPIRTPHAPTLHHHRPTPVHQQNPQSAPDDHPRHPRPQKHHSRQRSNTRTGPSPAASALHPLMHPQLITH